MADRQMTPPEAVVDPPPQQRIHATADPPFARFPQQQQKRAAGPQIWAVVLTLAGLYYVWTRVLGKSLPSFARKGNRIGADNRSGGSIGGGGRQAEIRAARERQQRLLQNSARAREMVNKANGDDRNATTVSKRANATSSGNNPAGLSINAQAQLLKIQQQRKQKEKELEEKKKKQRQLYLKQKALREKEEEMRKKDAELGPGWRYREDPDAATAVNNMNPQSESGGGGYKAQKCTPRRGGG